MTNAISLFSSPPKLLNQKKNDLILEPLFGLFGKIRVALQNGPPRTNRKLSVKTIIKEMSLAQELILVQAGVDCSCK